VGGNVLRHANVAVYPFYILHQTVIVAIAYHLIDWDAGIPLKFATITAGTLLVTTALYAGIRLFPVSRMLFGMKSAGPAVAAVAEPSAPREIRSWT
jgi:glucans biosynthesis protein C